VGVGVCVCVLVGVGGCVCVCVWVCLCVCVCVWKNTCFYGGAYSLNSLISKLFRGKIRDSLLGTTQYELFWSHACFKQHQKLMVREKCHNHERCFNYNYFYDLFLFSGGFGKLQRKSVY